MLRVASTVLVAFLAGCSFDPGGAVTDLQAPPPGDGSQGIGRLDGAVGGADGSVPVDDAPEADAFVPEIDAAPSGTILATLTIPVDGTVVTTTRAFGAGEPLRLRASGTFVIQAGVGTLGDAEYWDFSVAAPNDLASPVDMGIAVDELTPDATKSPHFGAYDASHVYEVPWTGTGGTLSARLFDGNYSNNTGSLTLEILSP